MARILVADDDEGIRTLLDLLFRADGHTVEVADDGFTALRACRARPFDLVFCDIFMPSADGLETIRGLRKECPRLRIVAMSGGSYSDGIDYLEVALKMGAAAILHKPFRWEEVKGAMDKALQPTESDTLTARQSYAPQPALS